MVASLSGARARLLGIQAGRLYAVIVAISMPTLSLPVVARSAMLNRGATSRAARGYFSAATLLLAGARLSPCGRRTCADLARGADRRGRRRFPTIYIGPRCRSNAGAQRGAILAIDNSIASVAGVLAPLVSAFFIEGIAGAAGYQAGFAFCGAHHGGGRHPRPGDQPENATRAARTETATRLGAWRTIGRG
jgi:hypothetical protein